MNTGPLHLRVVGLSIATCLMQKRDSQTYYSLFLSSPSLFQLSDSAPGSVFLLSRGSFSCSANLLPWRSGGGSGVYRKSHRRGGSSSENLPGLERLLKAWALTELPQGHTTTISGLQGPLDPYEPLLPLLLGPCLGVWRDCYLRGALHAQVYREGLSFSLLYRA